MYCILNIKSWMVENFLQLNQNQTEVLVIDSKTRGGTVCIFFVLLFGF